MAEAEVQLSAKAKELLPNHVAVIMDGNGRWARKRNLPRVQGHRMGVESVREVVRTSGELGIQFLTLYAFSAENWNRPRAEVDTLMKYLARFLKNEIPELMRNNVRLQAVGQIWRLPEFVQKQLQETMDALSGNNGLTLVLALSYGGRAEIVEAARELARQVKQGALDPEEIDEQALSRQLYTRNMPDPDLLIRTSGEMRVSNFLLWQISYAEFVVTPTLWPDFRRAQYLKALEEYARRHRRFGAL